MPPYGQAPAPNPAPNPYSYILNSPTPPKRNFLNSPKNTKVVAVLFVLVVLTVVIVGLTIFRSLSTKDYTDVLGLAQRQNEIVRVAELGLTNAHDPATLNYAATIRNVTASEQYSTTEFLKKKGVGDVTKKIGLKKDTATDKALTTAQQTNTYDTVFTEKINQLLLDYQKATRAVKGTNDSTSEKNLFTALNANARTIANVK